MMEGNVRAKTEEHVHKLAPVEEVVLNNMEDDSKSSKRWDHHCLDSWTW